MQVQNGVAVKADLLCVIYQQLDGRLVVQNHLRITHIFAFGAFPSSRSRSVSKSE